MLTAPEGGRGWKRERIRRLDQELGRGENSIGRKLSNLSFVAGSLGLPTLPGFGALPNIQQAIFPAIERYLGENPSVVAGDAFPLRPFERGAGPFAGMAEETRGFEAYPQLHLVEAPPLVGAEQAPRQPGLERLVRKFDPAARDHRNRALGQAGEERIVAFEGERLIAAGRADLARRVEWTSDVRGDGAGYDIKSFDPSGAERLIEVKTTRGLGTTPFFLTRTEREVSTERPEAFRLYRLYDFAAEPRLFKLKPPLEASVTLEPETWRAGFG
ncbi:MAG TPA: DUF3883 domain-containing protein [Caulobacteraceae bacterium]